MNLKFCGIYLLGVFVASIAQILLKRAAKQEHSSLLAEYLNKNVIIGYFLFFSSTFITIYGLAKIDLSVGAVLESVAYIFVAILSYIFLKEKSSIKQLLGYGCIVLGVIVFAFF